MTLVVADSIPVERPEECLWYQTFDWPDGSVVRGRWDYRHNVDDYLGRLDYRGKTVLEIGPASGFLTRAMEQRGASVTCVDTSDENVWEVVPRLDRNVAAYVARRKAMIGRLRKSWWLSRKAFAGNATISYSGASALGGCEGRHFDIGFLACVLQHFENPYIVMGNVARLCDAVVITEPWLRRMEDTRGWRIAEFMPARQNNNLGSWWLLSSAVVEQMMETLNFEKEDSYRSVFRRYDLVDKDISRDTFTDRDFYTHVYRKAPLDEARFNDLLE